MKQFILGITLFIAGLVSNLLLITLSVIKPHEISINGRRYQHLSGFLKGNGLEFFFYLMLIMTILGLLISIYDIYIKKIKNTVSNK